MIKPIIYWPEAILLTPTTRWNHQTPQLDCNQLELDLIETLLHEQALGLAANQIGIPYRVLAINTQDDKCIRIMYNPIIISKSEEITVGSEGCLSFDRMQLEIPRNNFIEVNWRDKLNYTHSRKFTAIDARCIQHEIDHLDGIVFKKYVSNLKFKYAQQQIKN